MRGVVVSRFLQSGDQEHVYDEFALSYVQLTQRRIPREPDGSAGAVVEAGWDANKGQSL